MFVSDIRYYNRGCQTLHALTSTKMVLASMQYSLEKSDGWELHNTGWLYYVIKLIKEVWINN